MINADQIKFRCSSLGYLMTDGKTKGTLGDTCKKHLLDVYIQNKYNRREEIQSKFIDKGNLREGEAITMLSLLDKRIYRKNKERLSNDYFTGECDIFTGESITNADETFDTKCSWSLHTFLRSQKEQDPKYKYQGFGYMDLTGSKKHTVVYCLVNSPAHIIEGEKRKVGYKMYDPKTFMRKCREIEINHIFDIEQFVNENPDFQFDNHLDEWVWDIPLNERVYKVIYERDQLEINRMHQRVIESRKWMNENLFNINQQ